MSATVRTQAQAAQYQQARADHNTAAQDQIHSRLAPYVRYFTTYGLAVPILIPGGYQRHFLFPEILPFVDPPQPAMVGRGYDSIPLQVWHGDFT